MRLSKTLWFVSFLLFQLNWISAQTKIYVYHTPSGTKYHTAKCRMVDNTSNGVLLEEALEKGLTPCTFCKPDENKNAAAPQTIGPVTKPGQKEIASRCLGNTQEGVRCQRKTKNANGFCFQHLPQGKT